MAAKDKKLPLYLFDCCIYNYEKRILAMELETTEKQVTWDGFVQGDVVNFFTEHNIEKMTLDDGNGNKAKLSKMKDCGIKIETSSTTTI